MRTARRRAVEIVGNAGRKRRLHEGPLQIDRRGGKSRRRRDGPGLELNHAVDAVFRVQDRVEAVEHSLPDQRGVMPVLAARIVLALTYFR